VAANANAKVDRPDPAGPTTIQAWVIEDDPGVAAARTASIADS